MSDTSQTDHEEFCSGGPNGYGLMMVVSAAFAQKLERELEEAREVALWLWNNLGHDDKEYIPTWVAGPVRSYRDAARAAGKKMKP